MANKIINYSTQYLLGLYNRGLHIYLIFWISGQFCWVEVSVTLVKGVQCAACRQTYIIAPFQYPLKLSAQIENQAMNFTTFTGTQIRPTAVKTLSPNHAYYAMFKNVTDRSN